MGLTLRSAHAQSAGDLGPLINDYLAGYWKARPVTAATPAGVHAQDRELEDWSAPAVQQEIARNRSFLDRLEKLDTKKMAADARADREQLISRVRVVLADLETLKSPQTRPDRYVQLLGNGAWTLASRQFAPATARFNAAADRLKLYPKFLKQARLNFENPPEAHTRKALDMISATVEYLDKGVPGTAVQLGVDKKVLARVKKESHAAALALLDFGKWMDSQLLPRSKGNPLPGERVYRQIFRDLLGTEMSPEQALEAAEREIGSAPATPPDAAETLDAQRALQALRQGEREPRQFVEQKRLAPIPMPDRLQFETAPAFWTRQEIALDPAGPFEQDLGFFLYLPANIVKTRAAIKSELVRRGHPGGYLQRDAMNHSDSVVRKALPNLAFLAGWEEYAALVMREAGYAAADPAHDRAVWLDAITDIRLHLGKTTPGDAIKMLAGQFRCPQAEAEYRVWRALDAPGELSAAFVGKLELLRLRSDVHKDMGAAFILGEYHTHLLSLGAPPFTMIRELLKQSVQFR